MSDQDLRAVTAAGSGKSEAEVAFDLLSKLKGQGVWGERNINPILDMYAQCLDAVKGLRTYEGQNRVDAPITTTSHRVQTQDQAQAAQSHHVHPQAQHQAQTAQPHAQAQPQTIHAQQLALQQAFKG